MDFDRIFNPAPKKKPESAQGLGFCRTFSDHMFIMEYDEGRGWHDPRIQPYGPLALDPASPVLHYAQEVFEGLKAYRHADGEVHLFRAVENARRMNASCERLCIPTIDVQLQLDAYNAIVDMERDWVPYESGSSLYLRPTAIADGNMLGVHAAPRYIYFIICSPTGSYFSGGLKPVSIYIEDSYVRSVKGGTGAAKTGGNYACSLKAAEEAKKRGFDQVLWLDGRHNRYIEEVGAMNMMFVIDGALITAPLEGSILPGITRDSVLRLARERNMKVEERPVDVAEIVEAHRAGVLTEAFGTGTAAVISPKGRMQYKGEDMMLGDDIGPVAKEMYDTLTGIQWGRIKDERGWVTRVPRISGRQDPDEELLIS